VSVEWGLEWGQPLTYDIQNCTICHGGKG